MSYYFIKVGGVGETIPRRLAVNQAGATLLRDPEKARKPRYIVVIATMREPDKVGHCLKIRATTRLEIFCVDDGESPRMWIAHNQ